MQQAPPTKILPLQELPATLAPLRSAGRRIVHCHGVFDLVHIGHIKYLQQSRQMGDVLVVTLTPDRYVNKGPNRPAFPEQLRAEALAALECVDYVGINHWPTAVETIRLLKPHLYVKGGEFRELEDVTGAVAAEKDAVEAVGGRIAFTDGITSSSSALLNRYLPVFPEEVQNYLRDFAVRYGMDQVTSWLDKVRPLKVLVVGEAIIDEYQYCDAIGKSSKEPTLVVRAGTGESFAGGILAVANHVAGFCDQVTVLTQLGTSNDYEGFIRERLNPAVEPVFLYRKDSPTIIKRRYIDSYFFTKLLEVYEINDGVLEPEDNAAVCGAIQDLAPRYDLVIVVDFGHSMISPEAVRALCQHAPYLALNVQANAGNYGFNTISKYPRADLICVAENEMRLEARDRRVDLRPVVESVSRRIGCERVVVTRGKHGSLCYRGGEGFVQVPALAVKVVDRMGAGDTFLSLAAPCAAAGAPMEMVAFLGNVAGAEAVATVGHSRYLERGALLKHAQALLK